MPRRPRGPNDSLNSPALPNTPSGLILMRNLLRMVTGYPNSLADFHHDEFGKWIVSSIEGQRDLLAKALLEGKVDAESSRSEWLAGVRNIQGLAANREFCQWLGQCANQSAGRRLLEAGLARVEQEISQRKTPSIPNVELVASAFGLNGAARSILEFSVVAMEAEDELSRQVFNVSAIRTRIVRSIAAAIRYPTGVVLDLIRPGGMLTQSGLFGISPRYERDLEDVLQLSPTACVLFSGAVSDPAELVKLTLCRVSTERDPGRQNWKHMETDELLLVSALNNALAQRQAGINIMLYGPPGTGKTEFARRIVRLAGCPGYEVPCHDAQGLEGKRQARIASLKIAQTLAGLTGQSIILLDEAEDIFASAHFGRFSVDDEGERSEGKGWVNQMLEQNPHPTIWVSNGINHLDPAYLRRFTFCLEFKAIPRDVRREIAAAHFSSVNCSESFIDAVSRNAQITPGMMEKASAFAGLASSDTIKAEDAAKHQLKKQVRALGHSSIPAVPPLATRFDTAYLNVNGAYSADQIMAALKRNGRGTLLMYGPPGTGKTQLAAEIARRLDRELVYRTASDINTMWFGESERNVARLFQDCDPEAEVLFVDEAETLLAERGGSGALPRAMHSVTAEFLRQIESFPGVFICATNHASQIDQALNRRFMFKLQFQPLTIQQRLAMLDEVAGPIGADFTQKLQARLAQMDGLTPGDFANVKTRFGLLGEQADVWAWIEELGLELRSKANCGQVPLGFV